MAGAPVRTYRMSEIRSKLLRPALTSHYLCYFQPPQTGFLNDRLKQLFTTNDANNRYDFLSLACSEASLPGNSVMTNEINNDYTGVTERHAYRRAYDDRADFTFYVDAERYYVIKFFESWIGYIVNEQYGDNGKLVSKKTYNYRVNFPTNYYASAMSITKFERDFDLPPTEFGSYREPPTGSQLQYNFVNAYPISISSMPVSYDSSQLLKCTVSFTYSRYWIQQLIDNTAVPKIDNPVSPNTINSSAGTITNVTPTSRVITNEYYNNFGDPRQNATNTADFFGAA